MQNGWYDRSWTARPNWSAGAFGPGQQLVACADIYPNGAFSGEPEIAAGLEGSCPALGSRQSARGEVGSRSQSGMERCGGMLSHLFGRPAPCPSAVGHAPGAFAGKTRLELVVKTDQGTPNLALNIGSDKASPCLGLAQRRETGLTLGSARSRACCMQPCGACEGLGAVHHLHTQWLCMSCFMQASAGGLSTCKHKPSQPACASLRQGRAPFRA